MKTPLLILLAAAAAACLSGCASLAGATLTFDSQGNATLTAPLRPIVIEARK
jgi:hypothetical protein